MFSRPLPLVTIARHSHPTFSPRLLHFQRVPLRSPPAVLAPRLATSHRLSTGQLLLRPQCTTRCFSIWRVPIYLATASKARRRVAMLGTITGLTAIGALLGPVFWLALGGAATLVSWRVWRATRQWWDLLNPSALRDQSVKGLYQLLMREVGNHRGAEAVRQEAIGQIMKWASTDHGRRVLLDELNLDHINDIDFYPAHASSSTLQQIMINGKKSSEQHVRVEFWAQDDRTPGYRGGSCCVYADAAISPDGTITLKDIRLSAPGWHADEHIPLDHVYVPKGKVIEGEYRDV
ncbi:hypothetical protein BX666DRAFT_692508 [Dichotomocladium elegans]|nr:hypothetical protein BX666DRAFT_692508 [Dichotomocladium elegans]